MNILQVKNLTVSFGPVKAVDEVSFAVEKNKSFGLVGESGSGKTMTALSIIKLLPEGSAITGGEVIFNPAGSSASGGVDGTDLLKKDERYLRGIRGSKISIVFQDPSTALDPVFTVGHQVVEAVLAHQAIGGRSARELALEFFRKVHIPDPAKIFYDYPYQLSGGTKQRIGLAMALVNSPDLVILDEPTTALDVTIQAQVLDLLDEIIEKEKVSTLFISHDFGIIARMCDHVGVMCRGRMVECGAKEDILGAPKNKYTISLIESVKALT